MERGVLTQGRGRRRRWLIWLALVGVFAIAVPWSILGAGASVSNPGSVSLAFTDGTLTTALGQLGPITGHFTGGTVDGSGSLNFPQAGAVFDSFLTHVTDPLPLDVTVSPIANSDFTGNVNPDTGAMTLGGSITTNLAIPFLSIPDCPLGPISLNLSTANPGGVPYNPVTGTVTIVDNTFVIPAIPAAQPGCAGLDATINTVLSLPSAPGASSLSEVGLFSPVLEGSTTTTASPTTTAAPTTTTTALPATTTTGAPSTTTTSTTTTPSTLPPTTTTTAAPTTTTAAPTTTTTTLPPTTTTAAAPTTTTTAAPTTTTTAAPTSTTSAEPTTTTTAGPTTTTNPAACNRPGNGFGDKNHVHCGPPGQTQKFGGKLIAATRSSGGMAFGFVAFSAAVTGLVLTTRRRRRTIG